MSDPEQRLEWAEHLQDEARAIAAQQVTAGQTHRPEQKPLPFSENDVSDAVRVAVLAERQRCAAVAASFADAGRLRGILPAADPAQVDAAAATALRIAEVLRSGRD
jgi:hypothetical protein